MCCKIRCDGNLEKFYVFLGELNKAIGLEINLIRYIMKYIFIILMGVHINIFNIVFINKLL